MSFATFVPVFVASMCILVIVLLINSSYGRAFKAIREDEIAAEAMGVRLFKHKQMAFCISCFFAGVGGALLAMFMNTIQAAQFKSSMTYEILLIVVLGGLGSVTGSCIASFLFIACSEWWLRGLDTVSYTHLDVYKRQAVPCAPRRPAASSGCSRARPCRQAAFRRSDLAHVVEARGRSCASCNGACRPRRGSATCVSSAKTARRRR